MSTVTINAEMLSKLFLAGASNLESKKEIINELNVFPVPDGDTGSNMTMTIMSAADCVKEVNPVTMEGVCKAISSGSLRGARGNSGVILSQLLRGFTKAVGDNEEITVRILADGIIRAREIAYKAVMKPKEGTILTVARVMAEKAEEIGDSASDIEEFGLEVIVAGLEALESTPDLLPVLKEAGVVDSGGRGLMEFLIGANNSLSDSATIIDSENFESLVKSNSVETKASKNNEPAKTEKQVEVKPEQSKAEEPKVEATKKEEPKVEKQKTEEPKEEKPETEEPKVEEIKSDESKTTSSDEEIDSNDEVVVEEEIKFGYCTEFIIMLSKEFKDSDEDEMKAYLNSIGDSIVCVVDDDLVKIHVHTNSPGLAMQKGLSYGELTSMKIDNLRQEHREVVIKNAEKKAAQEKSKPSKKVEVAKKKTESKPIKEKQKAETSKKEVKQQEEKKEELKKEEPNKEDVKEEPNKENIALKEIGFVAVSSGDGLSEIFKGLGVDEIITGGQTMNPSTDDILKAVEKVNAKSVIVLPNNGNIILAANQAASLADEINKNIAIIPSKSIPQGISAMITFDGALSLDDNINAMNKSIEMVKTGEVTYAVRDTKMDGKKIKENDIIGIVDGSLSAVEKKVSPAVIEMIENMVEPDDGIISLYYGSDVNEKDAQALYNEVVDHFEELDVEIHRGGQAVYYYIVSVE